MTAIFRFNDPSLSSSSGTSRDEMQAIGRPRQSDSTPGCRSGRRVDARDRSPLVRRDHPLIQARQDVVGEQLDLVQAPAGWRAGAVGARGSPACRAGGTAVAVERMMIREPISCRKALISPIATGWPAEPVAEQPILVDHLKDGRGAQYQGKHQCRDDNGHRDRDARLIMRRPDAEHFLPSSTHFPSLGRGDQVRVSHVPGRRRRGGRDDDSLLRYSHYTLRGQ